MSTPIGAIYLKDQPCILCPPGLEKTQGLCARPTPYVPVSFGAHRQWQNDEDGWTTVHYGRSKRRTWRGHTGF